jgi:hypothetical protein
MSDVKIEDVLVLNIQGRDAKCVIHESDGFYTQGWWLEGVGSLHGFEHNISKTDPGHNIVMKSCYLGDKCLFLSDEDVVANIGKITNSTPRSVKNNVIYDLSGRRLSEKPTKGIYVQGGRVYIAK